MEMTGHTGAINVIKVLNTENFASGSNDDSIRLWNIKTGQHLCTLTNESTDVLALEVTPLGHLASGSANK